MYTSSIFLIKRLNDRSAALSVAASGPVNGNRNLKNGKETAVTPCAAPTVRWQVDDDPAPCRPAARFSKPRGAAGPHFPHTWRVRQRNAATCLPDCGRSIRRRTYRGRQRQEECEAGTRWSQQPGFPRRVRRSHTVAWGVEPPLPSAHNTTSGRGEIEREGGRGARGSLCAAPVPARSKPSTRVHPDIRQAGRYFSGPPR
jgi:hypothetical protein